jgi:nucleotide-binding universal stress UspA family protein
MPELKLILCPIDFSEFSIRAYRHALSLAERYRAKLVAQQIVELWRYPSAEHVASLGNYEEFCRALREGGKEQLQEFVKNHTHGEIRPELVVHEGVAPDSILLFAQARKTGLIVMGTHGRRGYDRVVLGSVTNRVMRRAPCPVLAICKPPIDSSAAGEEPGHVHHLGRILFCTDFSENSERALNYAISATAEYDGELTLLHVLEDVPSPTRTEEAIATATGRLSKLIQQEGRKTLNIKTAGSGRKTIPANHSTYPGSGDRHGGYGSAWPWRVGSCGVWFDHLSRTAVGTVPRARRAPMNR